MPIPLQYPLKFVAKLTGEADSRSVSREFLSKASAIEWVLGDGLAEFDDQHAIGEVLDADGRIVWREPAL